MIRNVIVHLLNEQPVVADLFAVPSASDAGLVCTNLRTLDGRKPIFIERTDDTFYFPYLNIRFIEIPGGGEEGAGRASATAEPAAGAPAPDDEDLEIDEDFLRRVRDV